MFFQNLHPQSKVWVYTSDRILKEDEVKGISDKLQAFLPEWAAHGAKLLCDGTVYRSKFLIIAVDETQAGASGCSIDSSVRFVKELGKEYDVEFFNRMDMVIEEDDNLKTVHVSELKNHPNAKVFNPMITKLEELNSTWLIPVSESPFV